MGGPELLLSLGKPAHLLRFKRREQTQEAGGRSARSQLTADGTEPWTVPRSPDPWAAPARSSARLRAHPASSPGGTLGGTPRHSSGNPEDRSPLGCPQPRCVYSHACGRPQWPSCPGLYLAGLQRSPGSSSSLGWGRRVSRYLGLVLTSAQIDLRGTRPIPHGPGDGAYLSGGLLW